MTRKLTGEQRKLTRFHVQKGVRALYRSRAEQVTDISMGGVAFCCSKKKVDSEDHREQNGAWLTLSGKMKLKGLPVKPVSQSELTVFCDYSSKKKKLTRYGFKFDNLSPYQSMLLNHFIRTHSQEKCDFSMLYC